MDDPWVLPRFLECPPGAGARGLDPLSRVSSFDPLTQTAPGCPDFAGVYLLSDFLSERESDRLLESIEETPFRPAQSGKLKQHFGPKINFNKRRMNASGFAGIPVYAGMLEERLRQRLARISGRGGTLVSDPRLDTAMREYTTTDVFVLRYHEADQSNLDFHVDDTFAYGEVILDLSLESDAVLTFLRERESSAEGPSWDCIRVPLPARSMMVLFGPARFDWEHAILAYDVRGRRTSITMRTLSPTLRETPEGRSVVERARCGPGDELSR